MQDIIGIEKVLLPMLFTGLKLTLFISIIGIFFGFIVGSLVGYAIQSNLKVAKAVSEVYIWIIRGTPLIVQALYAYFVVPKMVGIDLNPTTVGVIVIALNSGAFISEIVKGALQNVDPGQGEAGLSLGLSKWQTMLHVIIPPALKSMLPALFNQFIISLKDTALLSVIAVNETTHLAQNYAALSFQTIPTYSTLALFYLALISILIIIQKKVEKSLKRA